MSRIRGAILFIPLLSLLAARPVSRGQQDLPPEVEAVREHILKKDYPELFKDQPYRTRIDDVLITDLDLDGQTEVVVQFWPHYRQSPSIIIYRFSKTLEVTRVKEGLAPGPLRPISGDYLDSHSLGMAVDFQFEGMQNDAAKRKALMNVAFSNFTNLVEYRTFFHVDARTGAGTYVDMSQIDIPGKAASCGHFEFSRVLQIAVGGVKSDRERNYLAAWVGKEIYVYLIKGFTEDGFLKKQLWILKTPKGFNGFAPGKGLAYASKSGTTELFDVK